MLKHKRFTLSVFIVVMVFVSVSSIALAQSSVTFTNNGNITIPGAGTSGPANPYPSTIAVSGVSGTVLDVNMSINGYNQTFPDDVDVLLVGPTGQTLIVMSDTGGSLDVVNVNLVFDDEAATSLPDGTQITSGTYRPTNIGATDTFPATAPAGPYGTLLSVFDGLNANGNWVLYINDDVGGDTGSFSGGWSITFTYQGVTITVPVTIVTTTPKFKDGRVNDNTYAKDLGGPVAIFCNERNGITVLFTEGDRAGKLAVNVSASKIDSVRVPADSNVTLGEANGVIVSRLTTSEYQVNATYADGKAYVVAWIGCPVTSFTNLAG